MKMLKLKDLGEAETIKKFFGNADYSCSVIKGVGDDAAVLKTADKKYYTLAAADMLVEGVHFEIKNELDFEAAGRKSVLVNLSDIAAMGGKPEHILVSVGVPESCSVKSFSFFCRGLKKTARKYSVDIIGGDTVCSKKIIVNVAVLGRVKKDRLVLRKNAKPGDMVFVTGSLGGSIKGRHVNFKPRLKESDMLVSKYKLNSMIDISDGLAGDAYKIAYASKAAVELEKDKIPVSYKAENAESALYDGEDFELLFTVNKFEGKKILADKKIKKFCKLSLIGRVLKGKPAVYLKNSEKKEKIKISGYDHFKK